MPKLMSKSELVEAIAALQPEELSKALVRSVIESLTDVGHRELRKSGAFAIPGLATLSVSDKPASEAKEGINPFTKEPMTFAAKPASKTVKARPAKAARDSVL